MEQAKKSEEADALPGEGKRSNKRGFFWFVAKGETLQGPFSTVELTKLIQDDKISLKFFAWKDGFKEWRPIYGIEEFSSLQKGNEKGLNYPVLPTPGHATTPAIRKEQTPYQVPVYKVRFARSRFSDLRKSEILGIFFITLLFSFALLEFAFRTFEQQWEQVWGKRISGSLYRLGFEETAVPMELVQPLLSAPGLKYQDENWMAVQMESNIDRQHPGMLDDFEIKLYMPPEFIVDNLDWDKSHAYTRRLKVQGFLNLKNPHSIEVEVPGLPFEPHNSKRILAE